MALAIPLATIALGLLAVSILFYARAHSKKLSVAGKCVLITGCDSGVGLSLAIHAHSLGFRVIATCLSTSSDGAEMLRQKSENILVVPMDVTSGEQVKHVLQQVKDHLQQTGTRLWAIVNNAGILIYGHLEWQTESQILNQVEVNLLGTMRVTKAFLPLIRASKGRIVNITSANGHWALPGLSVYCATKFGLEGLSHSLRSETIPWDVKVILINPGNIPGNTRILASQSAHAKEMRQQFSPEDSALYGEYFDHFQRHLDKNFGGSHPEHPMRDEGLEKIFGSALLLEKPRHYYENLTVGFQAFIFLFKILPVYYADRLFLRIWGQSIGYKLI